MTLRRTHLRLTVALAVVLALGICVSTASAAPLTYDVYTDAVSFDAAGGNLSFYDFESIPVGTDCRYYDFGDFTTSSPGLYRVGIQGENTNELFFNTSSYTQNMTLAFSNPVLAFGFDWRNTDNNDDMVRVDFAGMRYVLGAKDESGFWGVVATTGEITSDTAFLFGDTPGGAGWTVGNLDNFRYTDNSGDGAAPVPEPATLSLLGLGILGLGARLRRRK